MHESPSTTQLLQAVITFLNEVVTPQLTGHSAFHARVSANALALVAREVKQRAQGDARAIELYCALVSPSNNLPILEAELCQAIRAGDLSLDTPYLLASLREIAVAQMAIDQPTYSGLAS